MRIDQVLPSFQPYDAISTDAWLLRELIREQQISSELFTELTNLGGETENFQKLRQVKDRDHIIIYHHSIGSRIPYFLQDIPARKIIRYHNVTPHHYFRNAWSRNTYFRCFEGRSQLPMLRSLSDTVWSTSAYNLHELRDFNFPHQRILPVLRHYQQLAELKDCPETTALIKNRSCKNLLFVGRVVPHKGHHDLFFFLALLRRYCQKDLRLFCIGSESSAAHRQQLAELAEFLGLSISFAASTVRDYHRDIVFVSGVDDRRLASFYRQAEVFFNLSDHEGFCVPLVEAMFFGLPLVVQNSAAIPETVREGGLIVDKADPVATLLALEGVLNDPLRNQLSRQVSWQRGQAFAWKNLESQVKDCLQTLR